ncbi:tyrosine-type recombinase/integrase [Conexibacter sp. W3-3-2]|uniref:tyrosine-type recombinase/integrase n=1 Tax=Conexibacter sp. W3-3-2 TaxID=2675227 RepID=UPI0012B71154|nr:tyrosine-type recombinase/integrase [Conexibacter sp. W3-3-2]MTD44851.1 tyrosine-type recombinase/integrase [Conexibacter sp. W3-3-2]
MPTPRPPLSSAPPAGVLVVEKGKGPNAGQAFYAAKWRASKDQRQVKRRLGPAWLVADPAGRWKPRRGRVQDGFLDERRAHAEMARVIEELELADAHAEDRAADAERAKQTFRALAQAWLHHQEHIKRVKPSTLRDLRSVLAEPGLSKRRGQTVTRGRVLARFGDMPAGAITVEDVDAFLDDIATEGISVRTVNRYREVLRAIFNFGISRRSAFGLTANPAAEATLRRADGPGRLEVFDVDQVEALARAAASGEWRTRTEKGEIDNRKSSALWQRDEATVALHRAEDQQLAEMLRVACYTGLRRGELVVLRWRDVRWAERVLVVERALSDGVEVSPKSRRARYVPLADQPMAALERLSQRANFTSPDDFVFCNVVGDRLDPSALRRRYVCAREAAGLPPLRFHDLRHTAGSLLVRVIDPASVKDILGHADLKTTERYLHAQRASALADAATKAFASSGPAPEKPRLAEIKALLQELAPQEREALLAAQGIRT